LIRKRMRRPSARAWAAVCLASAAAALFAAEPATQPASKPKASTTKPAGRPAGAPADARVTPDGWFRPLPAEPKPALPKRIAPGEAFVIPIREEITRTTYDTVKRKALQCIGKGAKLVLFDMDTPGGSSWAMTKIAGVITRDLRNVYTVAFVNPEAISAGAVISIACDEIVLTPVAKIGDAMPIMISPQGGLQPIPKEERGKIESYARAEVRSFAERNGYNADLCESMITLSIEIWLIRNPQTRELKYLSLEKHPRYVKATKDDDKAKAKPPLDAPWEYVRRVVGPLEILTMTDEEATDLGFARHVVDDMDALCELYGVAGEPTRLSDTWSVDLVAFLTSPVVAGILMFVGILGIYVELNTPGLGLPGLVAVIAFVILFGSRSLIGLANWWEIGLFVLGLLLLGIEIFVTPGFGVMGIAGIFCCVAGLLAIMVANPPDEIPLPTTDIGWEEFRSGLVALMIGFLAAVGAAIVLARYLPSLPVANRLILPPKPAPEPGTIPEVQGSGVQAVAVGQVGVVASICRPVGQVRIQDRLVDAVADGAFIPTGTKVKVVKNEGNRLVVTAMEQ